MTGIRVLLVDDDPLTLQLHESYVARVPGFTVVGEALGARSAFTAMADEPGGLTDLVLLDVTMPDGTGVSVLRQLRARGVTTDVIAVTAVREAKVVEQMAALGVVQYLVKPFTFVTFKDRLGQYAEYRQRREYSAEHASQDEIDALLGASRPVTKLEAPKGLSITTLRQVTEAVRVAGALSSGEASEALGMSRVAARRYLEHLADEGRVERRPRYHGRGRPETEYRWR